MNAINKEPERHEIEALLPWHAAGTLSRRDADRVEQALAGDRELARRYDLVREELAETIHLNETLGAPSARAMEKLFAAIDAEEARSPRRQRSFDLAGRISEFLSSLTPRALAWSATAAAVAILLQAAVIAAIVVKEQGAPSGPSLASAPSDGSEASSTASVSPRPSCRRTRSARSCGRCKRNRRSSASSPRRSKPSGDGPRCGRSRRPPHAVAAPGFSLLLPTPKSDDQKTPGMALRHGADRNHA